MIRARVRRLMLYVSAGLFAVFGVLVFPLAAASESPLAPPAALAADSSKSTDSKSSESSKSSSGAPAAAPTLQSYAAETPLQDGTMVELKDSKTNKVAAATKAELGHMYGVTVDRNKLSVTITSGLQNEVYVATSGTYDVIVSSQGGDIKAGDYVTLSAVDGVAMKADGDVKAVFGRAAGNFNSKSDSIGKVALKDTKGKEATQVTLGIIPVAIDVKANPIKKSTKTLVPEFLQRIGEAIAEKTVSPIRMYLSIAITGITIVAAIIILYAGVRNSLISIGRNPLSKKSIFRGLFEIILTTILILIIGLFAVYLLLKL